MADLAISGGYTVDDLDWLRNELNLAARLELDPWGSLIVSPATDEHEIAQAELLRQAVLQLKGTGCSVFPSMPWTVADGTGYLMIPDLTALGAGWRRDGELGLAPPPLLVVEIASPSTRRADRGRKLADYRLGGAALYLLVDLPSTFELHDFAAGNVVKATGAIDTLVGGQPLRFTLPPA
ncbi:MAG TPA: Uma2 family endonuclease [Acidimicrobiales bacterium]|nr:Uma2 family endonuclease [Acidimicrobiales bacterium]